MTERQAANDNRVLRHRLPERLFHWAMAVCMLVLLATGFLPVLGVKFAWVDPHWIAGVALTVLVLLHIIRTLLVLRPSEMWVRWRELRNAVGMSAKEVLGAPRIRKSIGKYSVGQKIFHHAVAIVVLTAIGTGLVMMAGIDGPFWERNPFLISAQSRGLMFVLHGFAGLFSVTMIMVHVYFAVRPEKRYMTRSMLGGYITRDEFERHHDPDMWQE